MPRIRRVAFLSTAGFPKEAYATNKNALQATAASMKVELHDFVLNDAAEFPEAFRAMGKAAWGRSWSTTSRFSMRRRA